MARDSWLRQALVVARDAAATARMPSPRLCPAGPSLMSPVISPLLTVNETAARLRVSAYSVRAWANAGRLTGAERAGRLWRFAPDAAYVATPTVARTGRAQLIAYQPRGPQRLAAAGGGGAAGRR